MQKRLRVGSIYFVYTYQVHGTAVYTPFLKPEVPTLFESTNEYTRPILPPTSTTAVDNIIYPRMQIPFSIDRWVVILLESGKKNELAGTLGKTQLFMVYSTNIHVLLQPGTEVLYSYAHLLHSSYRVQKYNRVAGTISGAPDTIRSVVATRRIYSAILYYTGKNEGLNVHLSLAYQSR